MIGTGIVALTATAVALFFLSRGPMLSSMPVGVSGGVSAIALIGLALASVRLARITQSQLQAAKWPAHVAPPQQPDPVQTFSSAQSLTTAPTQAQDQPAATAAFATSPTSSQQPSAEVTKRAHTSSISTHDWQMIQVPPEPHKLSPKEQRALITTICSSKINDPTTRDLQIRLVLSLATLCVWLTSPSIRKTYHLSTLPHNNMQALVHRLNTALFTEFNAENNNQITRQLAEYFRNQATLYLNNTFFLKDPQIPEEYDLKKVIMVVNMVCATAIAYDDPEALSKAISHLNHLPVFAFSGNLLAYRYRFKEFTIHTILVACARTRNDMGPNFDERTIPHHNNDDSQTFYTKTVQHLNTHYGTNFQIPSENNTPYFLKQVLTVLITYLNQHYTTQISFTPSEDMTPQSLMSVLDAVNEKVNPMLRAHDPNVLAQIVQGLSLPQDGAWNAPVNYYNAYLYTRECFLGINEAYDFTSIIIAINHRFKTNFDWSEAGTFKVDFQWKGSAILREITSYLNCIPPWTFCNYKKDGLTSKEFAIHAILFACARTGDSAKKKIDERTIPHPEEDSPKVYRQKTVQHLNTYYGTHFHEPDEKDIPCFFERVLEFLIQYLNQHYNTQITFKPDTDMNSAFFQRVLDKINAEVNPTLRADDNDVLDKIVKGLTEPSQKKENMNVVFPLFFLLNFFFLFDKTQDPIHEMIRKIITQIPSQQQNKSAQTNKKKTTITKFVQWAVEIATNAAATTLTSRDVIRKNVLEKFLKRYLVHFFKTVFKLPKHASQAWLDLKERHEALMTKVFSPLLVPVLSSFMLHCRLKDSALMKLFDQRLAACREKIRTLFQTPQSITDFTTTLLTIVAEELETLNHELESIHNGASTSNT